LSVEKTQEIFCPSFEVIHRHTFKLNSNDFFLCREKSFLDQSNLF
jgi:hypothetical protein